MLQKIFEINKWGLFLTYSIISIAMSLLMNAVLPIEQMTFNSLSEQLSADRIYELLDFQEKWAWLGYVFAPIILLIKWSLISIPIFVGVVFLDLKISFQKVFQIVLASEFVFLLLILIKIGWLYFNIADLTLEYLQFFVPLSIINIFEVGEIDKWFVYLFQTLNLFELSYFFVLAYLFSIELKKDIWKMFEFMLSTYGVGLLLWVVFVSFLILNFS